jgi:antitoxin component YwqK of YwqJK toxin-antitoxin module
MSEEKITYFENGKPFIVKYYKDFLLHKEDGPAVIIYYTDGKIEEQEWFYKGKRHRYRTHNQPTRFEYWTNGKIKYIEYSKNDKLHREDGPCILYFNENGTLKEENYLTNHIYHRIDGPAKIVYDGFGNVKEKQFIYYDNERYLCLYNICKIKAKRFKLLRKNMLKELLINRTNLNIDIIKIILNYAYII